MFRRLTQWRPASTLGSSERGLEPSGERPLLLLLENYVLDCIGELTPAQSAKIGVAVQRVFGGASDWRQTLRQEVGLHEATDVMIQRLWVRNQAIARERNETLHPDQFAKMVVNENFAHVID